MFATVLLGFVVRTLFNAAGPDEAPTFPPPASLAAAPTFARTDAGPLLVGPPLTVSQVPASHKDYRWTIAHRDIPVSERATCATCHSQNFCETCHRNAPPHPRDMLYTHPQIIRQYKDSGRLSCYTCHQNISCARCHGGNVVGNP